MSWYTIIIVVILIILFNELSKAKAGETGKKLVWVYIFAMIFFSLALLLNLFDMRMNFFLFAGMIHIGIAGILKREWVDTLVGLVGLAMFTYNIFYMMN